MHAAMNIGIIVFHEPRHGLNHLPWLLRAGGGIQIDERMPVHLLRENGKILAVLLDRESTRRGAGETLVFGRVANGAGGINLVHRTTPPLASARSCAIRA